MGLRSGHPQQPRAKALGGLSPGEARLGRGRCLRYIETAWDAGPPPERCSLRPLAPASLRVPKAAAAPCLGGSPGLTQHLSAQAHSQPGVWAKARPPHPQPCPSPGRPPPGASGGTSCRRWA